MTITHLYVRDHIHINGGQVNHIRGAKEGPREADAEIAVDYERGVVRLLTRKGQRMVIPFGQVRNWVEEGEVISASSRPSKSRARRKRVQGGDSVSE